MELFQNGRIDFKVPTDAHSAARVWGPRTASPIIAVHVVDMTDEIWLEGVGVRGGELVGTGFRLQAIDLDDLCEAWLAARGLCVVSPEVVEAAITYSPAVVEVSHG